MEKLMEAKDIEKQDQVPEDFTTRGEQWKHIALSTIQKRTSKQKWLQFAENIQEKYASQGTKFDLIEKRVQAEEPKQKHSPDSESFYPSAPEEHIYPETEHEESELESKIEQSSHFTLDSRLKDFLAGILNIRIPTVKIYANQTSDTLAKKFSADALTYEDKILFKAGKYDPRGKRGIALLGHELTHAAQSRMQNRNVPEQMIINVPEEEERESLDNETRVLRYFSSTEGNSGYKEPSSLRPMVGSIEDNRLPRPQARSTKPDLLETPISNREYKKPSGFGSGDNPLSQTQERPPRTALSSRDLSLPPETDMNSNTASQLSEQQLRLIKDEVYRDIMNRIRIEFERGG